MNKTYRNIVDLVRDAGGDDSFSKDLASHLAARRIAHFLFGLRSAQGVSQQQMAQRLKCSQSRISKLENADDADWTLGELRQYLQALDRDVQVVVTPRHWRIVDQIKFHAATIRRCLERLVGLARSDKKIGRGVQSFHVEALYNLMTLVAESARNLPADASESSDAMAAGELLAAGAESVSEAELASGRSLR